MVGLVEEMASAVIPELCWCSAKEATDNLEMKERGWVPVKLFTEAGGVPRAIDCQPLAYRNVIGKYNLSLPPDLFPNSFSSVDSIIRHPTYCTLYSSFLCTPSLKNKLC